jgi:hypothetical protein
MKISNMLETGLIVKVVEDGEDLLITYDDGSMLRAKNAAKIEFVIECLSDPDYSE